MKALATWWFDRPWLSAALLVALTVVLASFIPRLEIDSSADGLMLEKDPARALYEQAKRRFGSDKLTLVVLKADDVFTPAVLGAVKRLSDDLQRLDGVSRVESLTTVRNIRGEGDTLDTGPLVTTVPSEPEAIAKIRRDALGSRVFVGNIVAGDGRATVITLYTDAPAGDRTFDRRFTDGVEALVRRETTPGLTIYQIGGIITNLANAQDIEADQARLVPLCIAVQLLVLLVAFRTPQGMLIPVTTSVIGIVWGMGLMALARLPMNLLTSIVPMLLIAIGFAEDVHMISEYHRGLGRGEEKLAAIRAMLQESALPLTVTSVTTFVGFGTLIFTDVTMLIQFGQAACLFLAANFVITMLLVPLALRAWPVPRRFRRSKLHDESTHGMIPALMERLGHFNLRYRVPILIGAAAISVGSIVGWMNLRVDTDFVSLFPKDSFIRQRIEDLHRALGGGLNFYIVVDTGRDDGVKDPKVLAKIASLQDFLARTGKVDKTVSIADYVRKMNREMHGGDPAFEVVPESADEVAQYLLLLEGRELAKFIDFNAAGANVVVRHHLTGSWAISGLRKEIDDYVAREFPPPLVVHMTGEAILTNNAVDFLSVNEVTSLWSTFVVIALIHAVLFMSIKAGALSMVPNIVPVLATYGLMGLLGVPLNIGTALIATVAIGIAVDDTVHHMVTYNRELKAHHDQKIAMFNTLRSQGRPIIYVSLALTLSFLPLALSHRVSTVQFGLLSAFVMFTAMIGELTLTPILMYSTQLVTLWDLLLLRMPADLVRRAPLFQDLSGWEARKVVLLGRLERVQAGEIVIRKGAAGKDMYMIVSGRARVFDRGADDHETVLAVLDTGAIFGEMGLVTGEVRSASVVAETDGELLRLDFDALERIRRRFPYTGAKLFRNLARILSQRLRHATEVIVGEAGGRSLSIPDVGVVPPNPA